MIVLPVNPVPKPRMTKRDKWKQRLPVLRYRAFADEVRLRLKPYESDAPLDLNYSAIRFVVAMPKSWTKKKRQEMEGEPHQQTPDIDNYLKALLDAIYEDDSHIHTLTVQKVWGEEGGIIIRLAPEVDEAARAAAQAESLIDYGNIEPADESDFENL